MKKGILPFLITAMSVLSLPAFSQANKDTSALLGLPGDNLDLYAVLTLFQKSKTIEEFEKSLNDEKTKINNLDLDLNKKIDFIKVVTTKKDDAYSFVLQVDVTKTETQDVAVILLSRDKDKKVSMQMVGDEKLYGKDYVIEPKGNSSVTANPGYTGSDPVKIETAPATTTVVVQSAPIVQYVYSPAYVPYYPPYYYGYYPPYFAFGMCIAVGVYRANNWGYHGGYHGGHYGGGNTVIINNGNRNQINHYNNNRHTSNTVNNNMAKGGYGNGAGNRGGSGPSASTRPSTGTGAGASNRPSTGAGASTRPSTGAGASTRPSTGAVGAGASTRPSTSNYPSTNRPSTSNRSSSSSMGSGGRSMSGGSSFGGGGGARGGGGGGRRR